MKLITLIFSAFIPINIFAQVDLPDYDIQLFSRESSLKYVEEYILVNPDTIFIRKKDFFGNGQMKSMKFNENHSDKNFNIHKLSDSTELLEIEGTHFSILVEHISPDTIVYSLYDTVISMRIYKSFANIEIRKDTIFPYFKAARLFELRGNDEIGEISFLAKIPVCNQIDTTISTRRSISREIFRFDENLKKYLPWSNSKKCFSKRGRIELILRQSEPVPSYFVKIRFGKDGWPLLIEDSKYIYRLVQRSVGEIQYSVLPHDHSGEAKLIVKYEDW